MYRWFSALILLLFCASFSALSSGTCIPVIDDCEQEMSASSSFEIPNFLQNLLNANGEGVPEDDREAVKWYRKAAEQGDALAQNNLGLMYANGEGVPEDDREAVKWYQRAVTNPDASEEAVKLATLNLARHGIKPDDTTPTSTASKQENRHRLSVSEIDNTPPLIHLDGEGEYSISDNKVTLSGRVSDSSGIADMSIRNTLVPFDTDGSFTKDVYVPIGSTEIDIIVMDIHGNVATEVVTVQRSIKQVSTTASRLTPPTKQVRQDPDAIALLIGVGDYDIVPDAPWSDSDAAHFYDYARNVLGVAGSRIRLLQEDEAGWRGIWKSLNRWLPAMSEPNKSNIYIFFAGHGLASADGEAAYLVPWDGDPDMLKRTAILRQEMIDGLKKLKPASVVMFMDTCYSGTAKGGKKTLVADARALRVVRKDRRSILPENFTLFSAAANDEIASSHPTLKHGLFSYWMMRGLGGEADGNSDNKITAGELHSFVGKNVERDAVSIGRKQHPQLVGDAERVIATW